MTTKRKTIAVIIAFAVAVSMMPSAAVCAYDSDEEPTLPASEMSQDAPGAGSGQGADGQEPQQAGDASSEAQDNSEPVSDDTSTEATTETETTTTPPTTKATTTINTSAKGWRTPRGNKTLMLALCCNPDGSMFDLRYQAGEKLYAYDTLQGATAGKGYGYFTLFNRKNNRVKIVKVRLSDMRIIKVSAPLNITHGNEITYNSRKNIIVVANSGNKPKRLSVINASTLTLKYHKTLKVSGKVKGMSKKQRKKFKGVGAIAYNEKYNFYVCRTKKANELLFLDSNLKPYKRIKQKSRVSGMLYQGMDSYKDCIMICQSFKGKKKYNLITVYNMKGKKLARFKMSLRSPKHELETIFHNGNQFYIGCYTSYGAKTDSQKLHVKRKNYIYRISNL